MKVLVLASHASSLINFRGQLIKEICQRGHQVIATAPGKDTNLGDMDALDVGAALSKIGAQYKNIALARTGISPKRDMTYFNQLRQIIRDTQPDRIFAYTIKPIIYGGLAARSLGYSNFYPLFSGLGYAFSYEKTSFKKDIVRVLVKRLLRTAISKSPTVIFQNDDDQSYLRQLKIISEQQNSEVVAGSGVDLEYFSHVPTANGKSSITFLMIARLLYDKGICEYAKAAKILKSKYPDARFILIGPRDNNNPASPGLGEINSWEAVEYLGSVKDVRPYLASCDVFVLPSYYREGTPRSSLEAMATGRAIVTTDWVGCRETVIPEKNGFLCL